MNVSLKNNDAVSGIVKLEIVKQSLTKLILKIMEFQFARSLIWKGETELKTLRLQKTF